MSTQRIIFAGLKPEDALRWVETQEAKVVATGLAASLEDYASDTRRHLTDKTILILPGEPFAARKINTPAKSRQQVLQSARFLLEDEIGANVDLLHLAVSQGAEGTDKIIIAAEETYIREWVDALKRHEILPDILSADFLSLRLENTDVVLLVLGNRLLLNINGVGFVAEREFAEPIARHLVLESDEEKIKLLLGHDETEVMWLGDKIDRYGIENEAVLADFLATNIAQRPPPNLLQGSFAPGIEWRAILKPWRSAAALLAASVVLFLGTQLVEGVKFNAAADQITQQASARFQAVYPELPVRNLRGQARQLAGVADTAQSDFLGLLTTLVEALSSTGNVELSLLNYDSSGVMTADVQFASIDELDALKEFLSEQGVIVSEGRTLTPVGNVFTGKLTLRAGS